MIFINETLSNNDLRIHYMTFGVARIYSLFSAAGAQHSELLFTVLNFLRDPRERSPNSNDLAGQTTGPLSEKFSIW